MAGNRPGASRKCGDGVESIGHIVSAYESSRWLGYKERHDNVLGELTKVVTSKWRITDRVQGGKPAKYKNDMNRHPNTRQ